MTSTRPPSLKPQTAGERCDLLRARLGCADRLVGSSPAMARVLEQVAAVAEREVDVLLLGPTGVGKTEVAQALHAASRRSRGPFVAVDCGALVSTLAESTLFGHERGAFTGAERAVEGHVAAAEGGTLFLDEVGELEPAIQPKLLAFLGERRYRSLGRSGERRADVRVVSATHRDLGAGFRADLYERLARYRISVPPLSERPEDIPLLARWLLERQARREGLRPLGLTPEASATLLARPWPRNVRELENALLTADVETRARGGTEIGPEDLWGASTAASAGSRAARLEAFDRLLIEHHLRHARYDVTSAARQLGMARSSLYERIRVLGIELHAGACDPTLLQHLRGG